MEIKIVAETIAEKTEKQICVNALKYLMECKKNLLQKIQVEEEGA